MLFHSSITLVMSLKVSESFRREVMYDNSLEESFANKCFVCNSKEDYTLVLYVATCLECPEFLALGEFGQLLPLHSVGEIFIIYALLILFEPSFMWLGNLGNPKAYCRGQADLRDAPVKPDACRECLDPTQVPLGTVSRVSGTCLEVVANITIYMSW